MLLATKKNEFHTNKVQEHIGYRVANTVHLMEILSGLYADPLFATIRELSTNASDAHIEVGTPNRPFQVDLPTDSDSTFTIRDFGPGLSKEKMKDVYTVYGVSDKSDSNDGTGCFGLGSKSPFTYCDMFTTISYHKSMKYIGINAINERGRPTFNIMTEEPTDEPDGLEVSFEIKPGDITICLDKAVEVYSWFDVLPTCNENELVNNINSNKKYRDERIAFVDPNHKWKIFSRRTYDNVKSLVIMGNIAYPIDAKQFTGSIQDLINNGIELNVRIGDLDIAPSRDGLKYTTHTLKVLNEKISEILQNMKSRIEKDISNCKFEWDARSKFIELSRGTLQRIWEIVVPKVSYKGEEISSTGYLNDTDGVDLNRFIRFNTNYNGTISRKHGQVISIREKSKIVINDDKGKGHAQVRRELKNGNKDNVYYLYNVEESIDKSVKYITDKLGYDPDKILYTSNFPKPPKNVIVNSNGKTVKRPTDELQCQLLHDSKWGYANKSYWSSHTVKINQGTYYYVVLNKDFTIDTPDGQKWDSRLIYQLCNNSNLNIEVIGLTHKRTEKIRDKANWIKFDVFIKNYLDKWHSDPNNIKSAAINQGRDLFEKWKLLKPYLQKKTLMLKFLDTFNNLASPKNIDKIEHLITQYNRYLGSKYVRPTSKYTFDTDVIEKTYPMLSVLDERKIKKQYYSKPEVKDLQTVSNYINSIG